MADFETRTREVGLEFERHGSAKCNTFSEGSFKPKKYTRVIRVRVEGHNSNYLKYFKKLWEVLDRIEQ